MFHSYFPFKSRGVNGFLLLLFPGCFTSTFAFLNSTHTSINGPITMLSPIKPCVYRGFLPETGLTSFGSHSKTLGFTWSEGEVFEYFKFCN